MIPNTPVKAQTAAVVYGKISFEFVGFRPHQFYQTLLGYTTANIRELSSALGLGPGELLLEEQVGHVCGVERGRRSQKKARAVRKGVWGGVLKALY